MLWIFVAVRRGGKRIFFFFNLQHEKKIWIKKAVESSTVR